MDTLLPRCHASYMTKPPVAGGDEGSEVCPGQDRTCDLCSGGNTFTPDEDQGFAESQHLQAYVASRRVGLSVVP